MISLKKLLYKMVEAINANHLPAATTTDKGKVLGIKNDGTYGLIPQSGDGGGGWETVVLTGTIEHVASSQGTGSKAYSRAELASLGISNFDEWTVVSVKQTDIVGGGYRYGAMYNTDLSGMATYGNSYPLVFTQSNSNYFFCINVLNTSERTGEYDDIDYEVVLARKTGGGGGGSALEIQRYTGTIGTIEANSFGYLNVPFSELGITDPDSVTILSVEYFIAEIRANNPSDESPVGYAVRRDMGSNGYVRLICRNNNSYGLADVRVQIRYIVEAE